MEVCNELGLSIFRARNNEAPKEMEDWDEDLDLYFSVLQENDCDECYGSGSSELMWNTVWEIEKSVSSDEKMKVSESAKSTIERLITENSNYMSIQEVTEG